MSRRARFLPDLPACADAVLVAQPDCREQEVIARVLRVLNVIGRRLMERQGRRAVFAKGDMRGRAVLDVPEALSPG